MKTYYNTSQITESGHYWWLPESYKNLNKGFDKNYWSIICIVPGLLNMDKVGEFVGPIEPPVWKTGITIKEIEP